MLNFFINSIALFTSSGLLDQFFALCAVALSACLVRYLFTCEETLT